MLFECVLMACKNLVVNKLRTLLTMLGIVIGIAAVIAMISIGLSVRSQVENSIASLGSNMLTIMPGAVTTSGVRLQAGSNNRLTLSDEQAIKRSIGGVLDVAGVVSKTYQVVYENQNWYTQILGTTPEYYAIRNYEITAGRLLNDLDERIQSKNCLVGKTTVDNLLAGVDPIGKTIRIDAKSFKVVGVLASKGQGMNGNDQDDVVIVPLSTAQNRLLGITYLNYILVTVDADVDINEVEKETAQLIRLRHKIAKDMPDDFSIRNSTEILNLVSENITNITGFLGLVAGISLLVGGIGIMNIMLVSVTERTREIGIRKALGATFRDILYQFIIESIVISVIGSIIGIIIGLVMAMVLAAAMSWQQQISYLAIIVAVAFSIIIGVFFGVYPARKAALLDPIQALRHD